MPSRLSTQSFLLWLPIILVTLFGALLRIYSVSKPFTGDEMTVYLFFLRGGWHSIFQAWADPYPPFLIDVANHPVNNILSFISLNAFAEVSVWSLRLPSFLFGCLTIPVVYAIGLECTQSRRVAFFSALGLALANGHVQWSGISRGYSSMLFFEALLLLTILHFQHKRSIPLGIAVVVSGVLMVYSQFVSLAVIASLVTAIILYAMTRKPFVNEGSSRLKYVISNALLFILIGLGTAIIYLPQFSVLDTLLSVIREGKLPDETFGQIPGFGGESAAPKHVNPTWTQVSDFVMGVGPVAGLFTAALWFVGLVLLAKRNAHAAFLLGSIVIVPLLVILITQSTPRGRYLLFALPVYCVPLGYLIHRILLRVQEILVNGIQRRNIPLKIASGLIGVSILLLLNLPATLAFIQDPRPARSGAWQLDEAEAFIQRETTPNDLIWVFPVGPPENAANAEGYLQPYGWFQQLGGLGKLDYQPAVETTTRIFYISPYPPEFEQDYLPEGFRPEPVATFGRTTVYRGELATPKNHAIPVPGAWTLYFDESKRETSTPQPVTIEVNEGTTPFPIKINALEDASEGMMYSAPFLVSPRRPVQMLLEIEAEPRYLSLTPFLFGLTYFDEQGNSIHNSFASGWQDAQQPPESNRHKLRVTGPVPPKAYAARFTILVEATSRQDDYALIHSLSLHGDW